MLGSAIECKGPDVTELELGAFNVPIDVDLCFLTGRKAFGCEGTQQDFVVFTVRTSFCSREGVRHEAGMCASLGTAWWYLDELPTTIRSVFLADSSCRSAARSVWWNIGLVSVWFYEFRGIRAVLFRKDPQCRRAGLAFCIRYLFTSPRLPFTPLGQHVIRAWPWAGGMCL